MRAFVPTGLKFFTALFLFAIISFSPSLSDEGALTDPAIKAPASHADTVQLGPWGVDLKGMNINVFPGDDFYQFANGKWIETVKIAPQDRSAGPLRQAQTRTVQLRKELIADLSAQTWPKDSDEAKFLNIYASYLDRSRVNQLAKSPIRPFSKYINRARTAPAIAQALGNVRLDLGSLFEVTIRIDPEGGEGYVPSLEMADLLLGTRHHYIREDQYFVTLRAEVAEELVGLLRQTGQRRDLNRRVRAVLNLETKLARLHPAAETLRNPSRDNVFLSLEELESQYPAFPWASFFSGSNVRDTSRIHVRLGDNLEAITHLFNKTPKSVWRDYLRLQLIIRYGPYLSDPIAEQVERFQAARRGTELAVLTPEDKAGRLAASLIPDVLARAYLQTFSTDNRLDNVHAMAEAIREAYRQHIMAAEWLSGDTKQRALEKLDGVEFIIGGPVGRNNYSQYAPLKNRLFTNVYWARQLRKEAALSRLDRPKGTKRPGVDTLRSHLFFSPLRVGAYYLPRVNTIIIPANYLQPPYYDPAADMAVNFGALGSTIGHELGHAFDDQGAQYGPDGQLENWWTPQDRANFKALGQKLSAQFAAYEAAPGVFINPDLTLGENLSDLAGLRVAYRAYQDYLAATGGPLSDLQDAKQRFFLGYAQKRRLLRRSGWALEQALTDPHSPATYRVNGIVRNLDLWYEAFDVGPEHELWLAPEDRVTVW